MIATLPVVFSIRTILNCRMLARCRILPLLSMEFTIRKISRALIRYSRGSAHWSKRGRRNVAGINCLIKRRAFWMNFKWIGVQKTALKGDKKFGGRSLISISAMSKTSRYKRNERPRELSYCLWPLRISLSCSLLLCYSSSAATPTSLRSNNKWSTTKSNNISNWPNQTISRLRPLSKVINLSQVPNNLATESDQLFSSASIM